MAINRRQWAMAAFGAVLLTGSSVGAGPADEAAIAKQLEAFRAAQLALDAKTLDALCATEVSYSHSDGRVEDKAQFVTNATTGRTKFVALDYKDAKVKVVGDVATARFQLVGDLETIADGKRAPVNLHILTTWIKQGGTWKLLSRGATRL